MSDWKDSSTTIEPGYCEPGAFSPVNLLKGTIFPQSLITLWVLSSDGRALSALFLQGVWQGNSGL